MPRAFSCIVKAVLSKLYAKTVVRAFVQTGNKPFYYLACQKVEALKVAYLLLIKIRHCVLLLAENKKTAPVRDGFFYKIVA